MYKDNYKFQNRLIEEVAAEMNVSPEVVYKIVKSQWDMLKKVISDNDPDNKLFSLKIRQLGIFGVKNNMMKIKEDLKHLHVPKDKIVKHIDPRKQNTN